jgi:hypothetical protein
MARNARTPLRVLYDLLCAQGYCDTQVQFADLLRISRSNIASYRASPGSKYRISPRLDSLHCWAWAVSRQTGLEVALRVDPRGEVLWEAGGWNAKGKQIEPVRLETSFREHDARPLSSWAAEWGRFLEGHSNGHSRS